MRWRLLKCALGFHNFGLPIAGVQRIYCRCLECGTHSKGVEVAPAKILQRRIALVRSRIRVW
jgi:hypothetical protein